MKPGGARLIALSVAAWVVCFAVLARWHTWLPFAYVGVALTIVAIATKTVPGELFRPSPRWLAAGVFAGAVMVAFTHLAYRSLTTDLPSVSGATRALFGLLSVTGASRIERAVLIVLIASCEEALFRGPLAAAVTNVRERSARRLGPKAFRRILGCAALYALATAPLGSPLLVLCAFTCGTVWGAMAVATGSLSMPVLAHVIWDLGVLVVWPVIAASRS